MRQGPKLRVSCLWQRTQVRWQLGAQELVMYNDVQADGCWLLRPVFEGKGSALN